MRRLSFLVFLLLAVQSSGKNLLISYKNEEGKKKAETIAGSVTKELESIHLVAISVPDNSDAEAALAADEDVDYVEEDMEWTAQGEFEGIVEHRQLRRLSQYVGYGITMVQAHQVWAKKPHVPICVVDSGVDADHVDLDRNRMDGSGRRSKITGKDLVWDKDQLGHGTHIAGIIGARVYNNLGIRGIGNLPLYITRGLNDDGRALQSEILEALEQCEKVGTKVISLSLGGTRTSSSVMNKIKELEADGVLIIAAAGNSNSTQPFYPAAFKEVVAVAAVDAHGLRWTSTRSGKGSNMGSYVELAAPGGSIYSTIPNNRYAKYSGTSMAAPFVAGIASVLWSRFPQCSARQIRYAMAYTANGKGTCTNEFGFGVVKARNAFEFLNAHPCPGSKWGQHIGNGECSTIDVQPDT